MSHQLSKAKTGFDLELLINGRVLKHVIQLVMDCGEIPDNFTFGPLDVSLWAASEDVINRTYEGTVGAAFAGTREDAFDVGILDFPDQEDHVYLRIVIVGELLGVEAVLNAYVRLKRSIDFLALLEEVNAFLEDEGPDLDLTEYVKVVALQAETATFDPENPLDQVPELYLPALDLVNETIRDLIVGLKEEEGGSEALLDFLLDQTDPLNKAIIDRIELQSFQDNNNLGIYVNLLLLDHDRGYRDSNRGDISKAEDFLGNDLDFALATAPGFLAQLIDDIVIKTVLDLQLEDEMIKSSDLESALLFEHFPLRIPNSIFNYDGNAGNLYIKDISVSGSQKSYEDEAGNKTKGEALKVVIKTDGYLGNLLKLASENVVIFGLPIDRDEAGLNTADIYYETNLRADLLRTLFPANPAAILFFPVLMIINLFFQKNMVEGTLEEMGIDALMRLRLLKFRWDPFYYTHHELLLEKDSMEFADERLFYAGNVHLSKSFESFENIYPRDVTRSAPDQIERVLYRVDSGSEIRETETFFATDRMDYIAEVNDSQSRIYSLPLEAAAGSIEERIEWDRLRTHVPFEPYCTSQNEAHITFIKMLSERELALVESALKNEFLDALTKEYIGFMEASFGTEIAEEVYEEVYDILFQSAEGSPDYEIFQEEYLEMEIEDRIYEGGTLRLSLSPQELHELTLAQVLFLPRYTPVVREGRLYYRNVANDREEDNLLSLPECD